MSIQEIYVREDVLGQTPVDSPNWEVIPTSGAGGIGATPVTSESNRVRSDLGASGSKTVGFDIGGQYPPFEFKADQVDFYLESAMRNRFATGTLTNGTEIVSASIQRAFQSDSLTDRYLNYRGAIVSQLDLVFGNIREDVTLSPTFLGLGHSNQESVSAVGAGSIVAETGNQSLTVLNVSNVSLGGLTSICMQQGNLSLQNTATAQYCAGMFDAIQLTLGTFLVNGQMTLILTDDTWPLFLNRDESTSLPFSFVMGRTGEPSYQVNVPSVQVTFDDPTTVASGEAQTITVDINANQDGADHTLEIIKS